MVGAWIIVILAFGQSPEFIYPHQPLQGYSSKADCEATFPYIAQRYDHMPKIGKRLVCRKV